MASTFPCGVQPKLSLTNLPPRRSCSKSTSVANNLNLRCEFVLGARNMGWCRRSKLGPSCGWRSVCWFRFGKNGMDAEGAGIYGSQARDDFDRDDVEQYFNYMGMLAVEGSYDKMEALLNEKIHPVDILLLMAASEGDKPKIEELLRAGADYSVKDADGRTALDRAASDDIKDFILSFSAQKA